MKIALAIPCYGDPKGKFVQCLADMIVHTKDANLRDAEGEKIDVEIQTFIVSSSILTESRHRLVAEAVLWGADFLLWMDADHVFPADALCRLWSRNLPVVGVNYARRCDPTAPTAAKIVTDDIEEDVKNLVYTTKELADAGEVEEVSHLGFGLCLIDMRVFDVLQAQAEKEGSGSFLPLFQFTVKDDGIGMIGEDVFFFNKLRNAGFKVWCDHALSWEVGHLHDSIVFNAHAVSQKDRWVEKQKNTAQRFLDQAKALEAEDAG